MLIQQHVGLDVHKKTIYGVVVNNDGEIIIEEEFASEPHCMEKFMQQIDKNANVALESCICWEHVYDYLVDMGFENISLANPSRVGLIAKSKKKTDKHDAEILANLVRTKMLPLSYAPTTEIRNQRRITRFRTGIAQTENIIKNRVHAILLRNGFNNPFDNIFTNKGLEYLRSLDLDWADRIQMDEYILNIKFFELQKKRAEKVIEEYSITNPDMRRLETIPGVGKLSALIIVGEIGDLRRFKEAKKLTSFAGLNPSVSQSGDKCFYGHISKRGNAHLRRILNQCSNIAVLKDSNLAKIYHRIKKRRGHKIAITAVSRKLLCYIFTMLKNNINYNQLYVNKKVS